jgi:hypothetical protein
MDNAQLTTWLKQQYHGVLSTHSVSPADYPFGSVVPFIISHDGYITLYLSELAEHTRNIQHNNKVSLTVLEPPHPQHPGDEKRLTCLGELLALPRSKALIEQYLTRFPSNETLFNLPGFQFYQLHMTAIRVIAGFGKIAWVDPEQLDLQ